MLLPIAEWAAWERAVAGGVYAPPSLSDDGYVHLSTSAQIAGTLARSFAGRTDLVLLQVDQQRLPDPAAVRWEDLWGHGVFPHLYAPLPLEAVVAHWPLQVDADGRCALPEGRDHAA
jgi:uncharacterized protein (DUF952 family)